MPSLSRFLTAPEGQTFRHQGSSQWKQGMKTKRTRGISRTLTGPTLRFWHSAGPGPRFLLVLQWTWQAWQPMHWSASCCR